jgi:hypothetical protein
VFLLVRCLNKRMGGPALYRGAGGIAFSAEGCCWKGVRVRYWKGVGTVNPAGAIRLSVDL